MHKKLFTLNQVKQIYKNLQILSIFETKTCKTRRPLMKAILLSSIYFKGPLLNSTKRNWCLFIIINKSSRFPICICLQRHYYNYSVGFNHLFYIFGMPNMIHSKQAFDSLSEETTQYLYKGITLHTSWYNPKYTWYMGVQDWEIVLNQVHQVKPSLVHNKYHLHGGSVFVDWFIYKQKRKKKGNGK